MKRTKNASLQAVAGKPLTTTTKSENYAFWIDTANKLRFEVGSGTKSATVTAPTALDTNWHHVVGTFASGVLKIYVDGVYAATATAVGFTTAGANASQFQSGRAGTTNYYGGGLDEIAVYGTVLSCGTSTVGQPCNTGQIATHYTQAVSDPGFGNPQWIYNYSYDNNGNQLTKDSSSFTYDLENRLKTATVAGATTTNTFDGEGNITQFQTGSSVTKQLWDRNVVLPQLALELDGSNNLIRRYASGADPIGFSTGSGGSFFNHFDAFGSVANLTNAAGVTQWTNVWEPFGPVRSQTQNDPLAPANPIGFSGEYRNDAAGLINLRARQYDPANARFQGADPLTPGVGEPFVSGYAYVNGSSWPPGGAIAARGSAAVGECAFGESLPRCSNRQHQCDPERPGRDSSDHDASRRDADHLGRSDPTPSGRQPGRFGRLRPTSVGERWRQCTGRFLS